MPKENVTIELEGNHFQINAQKKALQAIAKLPAEDRNRITEIAASPKALKSLAENWDLLSTMFK